MQERRATLRRQSDRDLRHVAARMQLEDGRPAEQRRQRRRIIRHNCKAALDIQIGQVSPTGQTATLRTHTIPGRVLDLSATGASLFTHHSIEVATEFRLVILIEHAPRIEAFAVARWMKRVEEKNGYVSGIEFTNISPQDRESLEEFLHHLDATVGL